MSNWIDKLVAGTSATVSTAAIPAVVSEPGWYVLGVVPVDADQDSKLELIGSVSGGSLVLTARLYCISSGTVGEVTGSRVSTSSTIDFRVISPAKFRLSANRLYQVHAQVVGAAGDFYFGLVRRAIPIGA